MTSVLTRTNPAPASSDSLPPLQSGDRLTRPEFERRYAAMPHVKKAELIEGVVYMASPVSHLNHAEPHSALQGWLSYYGAMTPGTHVGDNGTVRLDMDNEPQPDAYVLIDPARGGQARISEDGYIEGGPELVAEVAASSASIDLHSKRNAYRRIGVREYIVWRVYDRAIDWFRLQAGEYVKLTPGADGLYRSEVLPGLTLDAEALLSGNLRRVYEAQQEALQSPEHAQFVARLAGNAGGA